MNAQVRRFLENNNLLDPYQFAYRRRHSTQTCIVKVLDDIREAIDDRSITIAVLFDFSRAFDTVNHAVVLGKIAAAGFSGDAQGWFGSYLGGRMQRVCDPVSGALSGAEAVSSGVPQGSVLGPLLFSLYVSDFGSCIEHCKYSFYADDLMIYLHCLPSDLRAGMIRVNEDIRRIGGWARSLDLVLNVDKMQAIIFGSSRFVSTIYSGPTDPIVVENRVVPLSSSVKYLGITLSKNLSWEEYAVRVSGRIRAVLYQLKLCRELLTDTLRRTLVVSLVFPLLDYCCVAFTSNTGEQDMRLQRAINDCVRFVCGVRREEHISPFYERLRWLKVPERRKYFLACLMHAVVHEGRPATLASRVRVRGVPAGATTRRDPDMLVIPRFRTETFRRSFVVAGVTLWNDLPVALRAAGSANHFKQLAFELLLQCRI